MQKFITKGFISFNKKVYKPGVEIELEDKDSAELLMLGQIEPCLTAQHNDPPPPPPPPPAANVGDGGNQNPPPPDASIGIDDGDGLFNNDSSGTGDE